MAILKLKESNERKEIAFEIQELLKMTPAERFTMMFEKSRLIIEQLKKHGHFPAPEIVKRKSG